MVNNHGDRKSPKWCYSLSEWPQSMACFNRGDPNHLLTNWDDPPSIPLEGIESESESANLKT